jgi:hypothetical protein
LLAGIADKVIDRGTLVYNGTRIFAPTEKIRVLPALKTLMTAGKW